MSMDSYGNGGFKGVSKSRSDVSSLRTSNARIEKLSVSGTTTLESTLEVSGLSTLSGGAVVTSGLTVGANGTSILEIATGTVAVDPGNIAATTKGSVNVTISGITTNDRILLQPPSTLNAGLLYVGADVTAANTVTIYLYNKTGGDINDTSSTWKYTSINV